MDTPPFRHPVVVFDLDGTLVRSTTVSLLLAKGLGHLPAVEELERGYDAHLLDNEEFTHREAALFAGTPAARAVAQLREVPWIGGVKETLAALTAGGCTLLLTTLAWQFAVEELEHRHFFSEVRGAGLEVVDGVFTGRVERHFHEEDKRSFVESWCAARGIPLSEVAAVGDSRTDLHLFAAVGTAVAVNASPEARAAARHTVDTDDLRAILPLLRG
ncbi:HAD family phosphatase [Streptomyces sp. NPDC000594]|uniref:HAD family hydrolase n=1 Tax=Streptomyces sp. NPDC000594 TaxID=3154261 RepID=UPI00331CD070